MFTIEGIANLLKAEHRQISENIEIKNLLTDSRSLSTIDNTLFFAIITDLGNGHLYIPYLYNTGVRSFIVQEDYEIFANDFPDANFILVKDSVKALQKIAQTKRELINYPVIGITGSNGKTVVKEFMYQLLCRDFNIARSPKSFNSQIGVPLSVWQLSNEHNLAIFEAGISKPGEMIKLESIIKPTIGVITGIGDAHQENFESVEEKLREKMILFKDCPTIIYNADNPMISNLMQSSGLIINGVGWSKSITDAPMFIKDIEKTDKDTTITFRFMGLEQSVTIPFTDNASIENIIQCLTVLMVIKPSILSDSERFQKLKAVEMRLEVKNGYRGNTIINDAYSNDLLSLEIALDFQKRRGQSSSNMKAVIISDIQESNKNSAVLYKELASTLERFHIDYVIGVGKNISEKADFFRNLNASFYETTEKLLLSHKMDYLHNASILIKGARKFAFEKLTERLAQHMHQTILEVDLNAIRDNVNRYKSMLAKGVKMVCMIKAQGYGIGAYQIARTLQDMNMDYLAVAVADEGKYLRNKGIKSPIIVMNPELVTWDTLIEYNLEPEIYSLNLLKDFEKELISRDIKKYHIHIKIDTGMHRLGFDINELEALGDYLHSSDNMKVMSVFSHLAAADDPSKDDFTDKQVKIFEKGTETFIRHLGYTPLKHILNTAGIERFATHHYDMARLGIGLYGFSPVTNQAFNPIATLSTTILQIKTVPAGDTIGYGCKGKLTRDSKIAIIPIGYADGFSRKLGNGNYFIIINGIPCPTIGNICMDTCMIDVTDTNVNEGDRIVLFGTSDMPLYRMADAMSTIPYEILTNLSSRIQRIYYQE